MMLLLAGAMAATPAVAGDGCFTEREWRAAHVQVLERTLQVTALECQNVAGADYTGQYNAFMKKFKIRLGSDGKTLKAHFRRVGGNIDNFVTRVANSASERSMHDMSYCRNSAGMFVTALAIEEPKLESSAVGLVTDHDLVGVECPAKVVASARHHRHKAARTAAAPAATRVASTALAR